MTGKSVVIFHHIIEIGILQAQLVTRYWFLQDETNSQMFVNKPPAEGMEIEAFLTVG